jgi:hypothetical protein
MRYIILSLCTLLYATQVQAQTARIQGKVIDAQTQQGLEGVSISLEGSTLGSLSDSNGYFQISGIPAGNYTVRIALLGYKTQLKYNQELRSEGNAPLSFALESLSESLGVVEVIANPFEKDKNTLLSIQQLNQNEIVSYPGGNNDIAKVVQSFPGVGGSVGGFRNDVIIRGGAPNENVYYLDGVEIPNINHFATQGSAGGPVGLLNVSFFENVSLSSSAFNAMYDNALSGVIQFDQRNGNPQEFNGNFRLGSSEAALTLEGPLAKKNMTNANTTFIVSARRSYLQFLFKALGLPFLPDYWDYQYKITHKMNKYNEFSFLGVGSIDDLTINPLESFDPVQQSIQDQLPVIIQQSNTTGFSWKHLLKSNKGYIQSSLSQNRLSNDFAQYDNNINLQGLNFQNTSQEIENRLRSTANLFLGSNKLSFGLNGIYAQYNNTTFNAFPSNTYSTQIDFFRYGLFVQNARSFFKDRVQISAGLRTDGNTFTQDGADVHKRISPRVAFNWKVLSALPLSVTASWGRYYKILPYTSLGYQDSVGAFVNTQSSYIQSTHLVLGFEYLLNTSSRISIEGFVKNYQSYPVSLTDSVSLANKGGGFEVFGNEAIAMSGTGETYGIEFLFQQKFNKKWYGILAYTLFSSRFSGLNAEDLPSLWDNRHLVSGLLGYRLGKGYEVSARFRYLGKAPFASIDTQASLLSYPILVKDYQSLSNNRLTPASQLDVRFTKRWNFNKLSLDLFVDVQNVLAQVNPSEPQYGLQRDDAGNIVQPRTLIKLEDSGSATVLPSIGILLNF